MFSLRSWRLLERGVKKACEPWVLGLCGLSLHVFYDASCFLCRLTATDSLIRSLPPAHLLFHFLFIQLNRTSEKVKKYFVSYSHESPLIFYHDLDDLLGCEGVFARTVGGLFSHSLCFQLQVSTCMFT